MKIVFLILKKPGKLLVLEVPAQKEKKFISYVHADWLYVVFMRENSNRHNDRQNNHTSPRFKF